MSFLCQNPEILYVSFIQLTFAATRHIIFLRPRRSQCAFLMSVTIQIFHAFSIVDYYFGDFGLLFS